MKILAIDDEQLALDRIKRILNDLGYEDVHCSIEPSAAFEQKYDLIFLDINMPEINGIDLAKQIFQFHPLVKIIFQTAYDDFAVKAFEVGSVDYILKPIESDRVQQALNRVKNMIASNTQKLVAKLGSNTYLMSPGDVCYVKADLSEVYVKSKNASGYMSRTIGELEISLEKYGFIRVHRSYLVNINKIKSLSTVENSKFVISFVDISDEIISSKDGAKYLRQQLDKVTV